MSTISMVRKPLEIERDGRTARALLTHYRIVEEMLDAEALRELACEIAAACLDEVDDLATQRFNLTRALWRVEQRLCRDRVSALAEDYA